jgi:hypothetical protein
MLLDALAPDTAVQQLLIAIGHVVPWFIYGRGSHLPADGSDRMT